MNPSGSLSDSPSCPPASTPIPTRSAAEALWPTEEGGVRKATYVAYTHTANSSELIESDPVLTALGELVVCSDFDELLNLLEIDAVAGIVFDQSVGVQEVNYITRWAHIFKPALRCLQRPKTPPRSSAAFFSSQQI